MIPFIFSIAFFLLAQIIRTIRWQTLLPKSSLVKNHRLLTYLSAGSLLNAFVPYRLGDVVRVVLASKVEKIQFSSVFVSVVVERVIDLAFLFLIAVVLQFFNSELFPWADFKFLLMPSVIVGVSLVIGWMVATNKVARKAIYFFSSIWNSVIQLYILDFFWQFHLSIKHRAFFTKTFLALTLFMWPSYFASYYFLWLSYKTMNPADVFSLFHGSPFGGLLTTETAAGFSAVEIAKVVIVISFPFVVSLAYFVFRTLTFRKQYRIRNVFEKISSVSSLFRLGHPTTFKNFDEYRVFLNSHFSCADTAIESLGKSTFDGSQIVRVFHGGSDAITALIQKNENLVIRKFGKGSSASKLNDQVQWLKSAKREGIVPVANIEHTFQSDTVFYYEMAYEAGAVDMWEYLHTLDEAKSKEILDSVFTKISAHHSKYLNGPQRPDLLEQYFKIKVFPHVGMIRDFVSQYFDLESFQVNGTSYSFNEWDFLLNPNIFSKFTRLTQTNIHGDLTIENIIAFSKQNNFWYFIDPNPDSVFKVDAMDWGKLFQSLNLGYEFLNRGVDARIDRYGISFFSPKTGRFDVLFNYFKSRLTEQHGEQAVKEAYLHEIIHYLRLIPYKLKKDPESGLVFFGCTCLLIRKYRELYGDT
mgnify:CR=1 FL=1